MHFHDRLKFRVAAKQAKDKPSLANAVKAEQYRQKLEKMKAMMTALGQSGGKGLLGGGMPSLPGMGGGLAPAGAAGLDPMAMFGEPEGGGRSRGRERARNADNKKKNKRKQARKARRKGRS